MVTMIQPNLKCRVRSSIIYTNGCNSLPRFKEEFGKCNEPSNIWTGRHWEDCKNMCGAYNIILKGLRIHRNLSQDRIEQLEEIGFQWQVTNHDQTFKNHWRRELMAFIKDFGLCKVSTKYAANPSFGVWCNNMIAAYNRMQKRMNVNPRLPRGRVDRLGGIIFQCQVVDYDQAFE